MFTDLVGVVGSGGSSLALLARGELCEVAVVVTLPVVTVLTCDPFVFLHTTLQFSRTSCGRRPCSRQSRPWG